MILFLNLFTSSFKAYDQESEIIDIIISHDESQFSYNSFFVKKVLIIEVSFFSKTDLEQHFIQMRVINFIHQV
jgi:hypothetical protein